MTAPRWTRVTPWKVCVSPLDDPAMPVVWQYDVAQDAADAVAEHNAALQTDAERHEFEVWMAFR